LAGGRRTKRFKLGFAAGTVMLAITNVAEAQQLVSIGYPPFGSPLLSLPGAKPDNFLTLDQNAAQGAMIDLYKAIANDAGFQIRFLAFVAGNLPEALRSSKIDILHATLSAENKTVMELSQPIFADSEVLIASKTDTTSYKTYADLKGQIVGSRTGTIYEDDLRKNGFEVKSYVTTPELLKAVNAGEVKVAINTHCICSSGRSISKRADC